MSSDKSRRQFLLGSSSIAALALAGCVGTDDSSDDDGMDNESDQMENEGDTMEEGGDEMESGMMATDPAEAPRAEIDRFSEDAGTLLVRTDENGLPGPDEPVNFDQGPFITQGYAPDGTPIEYYNFDVQPTAPAPIYAFFYENGDPVEDQLNIIGVVPGDGGYNDFWRVNTVTVPDDYEANTITSVGDLTQTEYDIEQTSTIKNCPVVPEGSTASKHYGDDNDEAPLVDGWYDGAVVSYFLFEEDSYETMDNTVPLSPIYVSFNTNPGQAGGGPASGFMTESGSAQTHNVVATLPGDAGYSPLWMVNVYDNADFDSVSDLDSAMDATILAEGAAMVNCPVVSMGDSMM
jgi:hypothetical protein